MVSTPNGTMLPIVYKGGLPYIEQHYPTDKQMREINREKMIILPGEWNPSVLDDAPNASQSRLKQFPSTPLEATDRFYIMEGDIIVQKTDIDDGSIINDNSSTSSGSRRRSYRSRTRKEKQKKRYGTRLSWWDNNQKISISQHTHQQCCLTL